ncbi:uncharacterized protein si:ch211-189a15.5 isoform X2 [Seriola aureovittata]|uniref:uncharacterized protein si:ch211-189a15.5 isoform X2 n=1 Tax=Seriola aureovittata TaxID=2871759 RepID=UPI0024BE050C|nr:uncharacterized protein si:ch211-189a15.5 isoform X2 [Seriola aureovittata]
MKDGSGAAEQAEVSRQELYEDYVKCYRQPCPEARPCRDERLLKKAAQYLLREPESGGIFTVFPFYQAVAEDHEALSTDCRRHLSAFIKATELLETLCVNLFLQPWKKEFKTLKTFTGPFVYRLLPVLSSFTIQSVLASIGYLPNTDAPHSEFRLSEDADPDRAILLGFELLLARVECSNLLEQPVTDQQGPQPQVPLYSDTRIAVKPQPKPRHIHLISADQSIIEMQRTYPDLAFRGRLLLPDKPHPANGSRSSSKAVLAVGHHYSDDSKDAELSKRDARAAATAVCSNSDGSKAGEVLGDSVRSSGCSDRNSGGTSTPANPASSSFINTDDDEFSGPQAISLHITLRAGAKAEQDQRPGESQPTAGPQQAAAGEHNKRPTQPEPSSLTTEDDEEDLRGLAERMGQLRVQEHKQKELRRRGENRRREDSTNKERRKKDRKVSTEGEAEEQKLRKPVMETGPALNHEASRCSGSSQPDPAAMKEQKQSTVTDCESCEGGGSTGQQEGGDPGPEEEEEEEEEEPPQSFVIV